MKIVIADTCGGWPLHPDYVAAFPNATFVDHLPNGRKPSVEPHPHGGLCASRVLMPLLDEQVEVHFIPLLNDEIAPADWLGWFLRVLVDIGVGPGDVVNCSWGAERSKVSEIEAAMERAWSEWVDAEHQLRQQMGYWIVFAGGNKNTGGLAYKDVGYPPRLMRDAVVVGAIDRRGYVTDWSSDGNLTNVDMGHYAYVLHPFTGVWETGSGTSFAAPSTAGTLATILPLADYGALVTWLLDNTTRPKGFTEADLPHPAFGYGQTMTAWEERCRACNAFERVGLSAGRVRELMTRRLDWFDFHKVGHGRAGR